MTSSDDFIAKLIGMADERGKLAVLRRGLGTAPGADPAMYPIIAPLLPYGCSQREERRHYLIASLFALHPETTDNGNFGDHMRLACLQDTQAATSRRFTALLSAHQDDLPLYLRQAVSFIKSKNQKINWHQLMKDIRHWDHPDRFVQRRWANAFWGVQMENSDQNSL